MNTALDNVRELTMKYHMDISGSRIGYLYYISFGIRTPDELDEIYKKFLKIDGIIIDLIDDSHGIYFHTIDNKSMKDITI